MTGRAAAARRVARAALATRDAQRDLDAACLMDEGLLNLVALARHDVALQAARLDGLVELLGAPRLGESSGAATGPVELARLLVRILGDGGSMLSLDYGSTTEDSAAVRVDLHDQRFTLTVTRRDP